MSRETKHHSLLANELVQKAYLGQMEA